MKNLIVVTTVILVLFSQSILAEEDDIAAMQRQLNAETMNKPFLAEQPEKVDAYIKEAMKKNIKPIEYEGTHWQRGYTCRNLLRWSWNEYRNCRYYHSYYGRYYPYY